MLHSGSARTLGHMIYYTIENETSIKHISSTFSHSSGAMLLVSNSLSPVWDLYFNVAYVLHCGLMTWRTASLKDCILTYTKGVLISWDPGGSDLLWMQPLVATGIALNYNTRTKHGTLVDVCNIGLRASRILRRGLSATISHCH
jgi:hypothetical protein